MNLPFYCQLYFGGNVINAHFYGFDEQLQRDKGGTEEVEEGSRGRSFKLEAVATSHVIN